MQTELRIFSLDPSDRARFLRDWARLDAQSSSSFFLSTPWITTWLERLPSRLGVRVAEVRDSQGLAALALLVPCTTRVARLVPWRTLVLHATGERPFDDLTVEFNGVLARTDVANRAAGWLVECALAERGWDELTLPLVGADQDYDIVARSRALLVDTATYRAPYVDLDALRAANVRHVDSLHKKARYQIRRGRSEIEKRCGPLRLTAAQAAPERREFLERLMVLHGAYWNTRGEPGAFSDPWIREFHLALIAREEPDPCCQLLRLTAGELDVGYLYNFTWRGRVYSYQSGFNYEVLGSDVAPGYLSNAAAIQYAADNGFSRYEFMRGENLYKLKLATHVGELRSIRIVRPSRVAVVLERLRHLRRRLRSWISTRRLPSSASSSSLRL